MCGRAARLGLAPMPLPLLPPAFQLVGLDPEADAFARAVRAAPRGLDDGTVYWTDRADRLSMAMALEPEAGRAATLQALHVLAVSAGDALGALAPPQLEVAYAWPDGLVLDGARIGRLRAALAPTVEAWAIPPWLVLGLEVEVGPMTTEPGHAPDRTTLADAGAGDVTATQLGESAARHFLMWTARWLEEGFAPIRAQWNARCFRLGETATVALGDETFTGEIRGLDEEGAFVIGDATFTVERVLGRLG